MIEAEVHEIYIHAPIVKLLVCVTAKKMRDDLLLIARNNTATKVAHKIHCVKWKCRKGR